VKLELNLTWQRMHWPWWAAVGNSVGPQRNTSHPKINSGLVKPLKHFRQLHLCLNMLRHKSPTVAGQFALFYRVDLHFDLHVHAQPDLCAQAVEKPLGLQL
jgi:hypothetical protein